MTPEQRQALLDLDRDGLLIPEEVIVAAEPEESPLHECFEWDDPKAAHAHRLDTARTLIRSIRVEYVRTVTEYACPVYIRDPDVPAREQGYVKVRLLRTKKDSAMAALDHELDQVASRIQRTRLIAAELELSDQCEIKLRRLLDLEEPPSVPEVSA